MASLAGASKCFMSHSKAIKKDLQRKQGLAYDQPVASLMQAIMQTGYRPASGSKRIHA